MAAERVRAAGAHARAQGLVGWWMVKSGLDESLQSAYKEPSVSPYRLAAHLTSAFLIYGLLLDTALKVGSPRMPGRVRSHTSAQAWPTASSRSLLARAASSPPALR